MVFKTQEKPDFKAQVDAAKARLAAQNVKCAGCFAPRNNLIVKPHLETKMWKYEEIEISSDKSMVFVPCMFCKAIRELPLSSVSMNYLKQDIQKYDTFIILKEGKYNRLVGCGEEKLGAKDII